MIIAIDGPSGTGKSTIAKRLSLRLRYIYIDTGAMYRAATLYYLRNCIQPDNLQEINSHLSKIHIRFRQVNNIQRTFLNNEDVTDVIRSPKVNVNVSPYSTIPILRTYLVAQQRILGSQNNAILDGRDIGTVVFPDADLKLFTISDLEIRTHRRYEELKVKYPETTLENVRENLLRRDMIDSSRSASPLKQAADAIILDNSYLDLENILNRLEILINELKTSPEIKKDILKSRLCIEDNHLTWKFEIHGKSYEDIILFPIVVSTNLREQFSQYMRSINPEEMCLIEDSPSKYQYLLLSFATLPT